MTKIKVSVVMITYGHEKYIKQAIEGVLLQECDFEVELIVANDCSPDNTDSVVNEIIQKHSKADRIKYTRHSQNKGMMPNFFWALQQAEGKYIAICEGDDYWIDPFKLQKQVHFLEQNSDYGLIHTNYMQFVQSTGEFVKIHFGNVFDSFYGLLKEEYSIGTLTTVFRKEILKNYIEDIDPLNKNWLTGDLPLWLYISKFYKVHYIDEVTSVYRVLGESASHTNNVDKMILFEKSIRDLKLFYLHKYGDDNRGKITTEINSLYQYRQIVTHAVCKGDILNFAVQLFYFYKKNRNPFYFMGSFKQIAKRFSY